LHQAEDQGGPEVIAVRGHQLCITPEDVQRGKMLASLLATCERSIGRQELALRPMSRLGRIANCQAPRCFTARTPPRARMHALVTCWVH